MLLPAPHPSATSAHPEPWLQTTAELGRSLPEDLGLHEELHSLLPTVDLGAGFCLWSLFSSPSQGGFVPWERVPPHSKPRPEPLQAEGSDGF